MFLLCFYHCAVYLINNDEYYYTHIGVSGNALINKDVDRLKSYDVWNYAEGQDSFSVSMLVDLTQPADKVSRADFTL